MSQIKLVRGDDWEGIYVNNLLFDQGHVLGGETYLALIHDYNNTLTGYYEVYYVDQEWLEYQSEFPSKFVDIPSEQLELVKSNP